MPLYKFKTPGVIAKKPFSEWTENGEFDYYRNRLHSKLDNPILSSITLFNSMLTQPANCYSVVQKGSATIPNLTSNPYAPNIQ